MPRIQPDTVVWTPENERAWNMPRQIGRSSGSGRRAQVDAIGRGAAAFASMGTGQVSRETSSLGSWSVAGSGGYSGPPSSAPSASSVAPVVGPSGSLDGSSLELFSDVGAYKELSEAHCLPSRDSGVPTDTSPCESVE